MMITTIRKGIKSSASKALLGIMFLGFLFGSVGLSKIFFSDPVGDGVAAVNGVSIGRETFQKRHQEEEQQLAMIREMLAMQYGPHADQVMKAYGISTDTAATALNNLIQEALLADTANNIPLHISPEFIEIKMHDNQYLADLFSKTNPGLIGHDRRVNEMALQRFLSQHSEQSIRTQVEEHVREELVEILIKGSTMVPSFVVKEEYQQQNAEKKFSIGTITFDSVLKKVSEGTVSDVKLKEFYDKQNRQKKRYYIPAKRNGTEWTFEPEHFGIKVSDKEIEAHYNKVKMARFIEVPAKVKVREIVFDQAKKHGMTTLKEMADKVHAQATAQPDSFADLAKEHSMKKETASKGGTVDFFKRGDNDKAYDRAAFVTLKKDGDISPVLKIDNSYVILQRVARKKPEFKALSSVKGELKKALTEQKFRTAFKKEAMKVSRGSGEEAQAAFEQFVKDKRGQKNTVAAVAKGETAQAGRLFALRRSGSKDAYVAQGKGVILELNDIMKQTLPPFEMMRDSIEKDYLEEEAQRELKKLVKQERSKAVKAGKLDSSDLMKVTTTEWLKGSDTEKIQKLVENGAPQDLMAVDMIGGVVSSFGKDSGLVIRLNETKKADETKFEEEKANIRRSLFVQYMGRLVGSFVASLNRNATIEFNESFANMKDRI